MRRARKAGREACTLHGSTAEASPKEGGHRLRDEECWSVWEGVGMKRTLNEERQRATYVYPDVFDGDGVTPDRYGAVQFLDTEKKNTHPDIFTVCGSGQFRLTLHFASSLRHKRDRK